MVSIEEMHEMLNDLADELPLDFYIELSGGISLTPDVVYSPNDRNRDLFILAQYHHGGQMGRYITVYYGSFSRVFGHLPHDALKEKLRHVLRHEFRHHLESMAGNHDLEIEDEEYIEAYLEHKNNLE